MDKRFVALLLSFLLVSLSLYAQSKGDRVFTLIDANTKEPIPYVSVSFSKSNGVYSDKEGRFTLPKEHGDEVMISHVSYGKRSVSLSSAIDHKIYLTPASYALDEVVVSRHPGAIEPIGTTQGRGNSGYVPTQYTMHALYVPYDKSWETVPMINEIFLNVSYSGRRAKKTEATILYYLVLPDTITGAPTGRALTGQREFGFDKRDKKDKKRYYASLESSVPFPREGVFIVFYVADPSFSYLEYYESAGRGDFSFFPPYSFSITGKTSTPRSWELNVYDEQPKWRLGDEKNKRWNDTMKGMPVRKEGSVYNYMGGVMVQHQEP